MSLADDDDVVHCSTPPAGELPPASCEPVEPVEQPSPTAAAAASGGAVRGLIGPAIQRRRVYLLTASNNRPPD